VSWKGLRRSSRATFAGADVFNYLCNVMSQQSYTARGLLFFSFCDLTRHCLYKMGGFGDLISKKKSVFASVKFL